jgi:hypothetical protein
MSDAHCAPKGSPVIAEDLETSNFQSLSRSRSKAVAITVVLLLVAVLPIGCHQIVALAPCSSSNSACTGLDLTNIRFEVIGQPTLRESQNLWLSGQTPDQLAVRWDSYTFHLHPNGQACNVDECLTPLPSCNQNVFTNDPVLLPVVDAFPGFVTNASPQVITLSGGVPIVYRSGCRSYQRTAGFVAPNFTPSFSGTYEVHTPVVELPDVALKTTKIFVVTNTPQLASYQTNQYTETLNPSYVWYTTWQQGNDATRVDNFSANLQVSKVRVLRGIPKTDPVTGMLALDNATSVRPSSIVLIPTFDHNLSILRQNHIRCYADNDPTGHPDGNIDLTNCFTGLNNTGTPPMGATPTYLKAQPADMLNWFAEFNPNESQTAPATAPVLSSGEVIAIEFTIVQG